MARRTAGADLRLLRPANSRFGGRMTRRNWMGMTACLALTPDRAGAQAVPDSVEAREKRSALEVAQSLSRKYGQALPQVTYIPALALWGRLWLAEIQEQAGVREEIAKLVEAAPRPSEWSGPVVAGHLIHAVLGDRERVLQAAALGLDENGEPRPHLENSGGMSDSVFMDCPLLTAAGRLTEEDRFFTAAANHLFFMEDTCLREDGLYNHSQKCQAAWGRGNGFPAMGLALVLTEFSATHPDHPSVTASFTEHLTALAKHQDAGGMWHQVIDRPDSYAEFTCTCMIGFAAQRGVRLDILEKSVFQPLADRAWTAIRRRIHLDGETVEGVCPSTGALPTLEDYLKRPAHQGRDDRGGAMALMFAVERLAWEKGAEEP